MVPGKSFARLGSDEYAIQPGVRDDYDALFGELQKRGDAPEKILHLWSVCGRSPLASLEEALNLSFYSLLFLAQVLGEQDLLALRIGVVSDRLQSVSGEPITEPVRAALLGPTKVMLKEFPGITCRAIDLNLEQDSTAQAARRMPFNMLIFVKKAAADCPPCPDRIVMHAP